MTKPALSLLLILFLITACGPVLSPAATQAPIAASTSTVVEPISYTPPQNKDILVTNSQDSGPGSLRQALLDAGAEALISFDPIVFPLDNPTTIMLLSALPTLEKGQITLDASRAGVILDGSQAGGEWIAGLDLSSNKNVVRGLQITGFSGPGILVRSNAAHNTIGGEPGSGQSNLIRNCAIGIMLRGPDNIIAGNLIGTDRSGQKKWGNSEAGIVLEESANRNVIGPGNIIAFNGTSGSGGGVDIQSTDISGNRITQNDIHNNADRSIYYDFAQGRRPAQLPQPPQLLELNLLQGEVSGLACPYCTVEFFTTSQTTGGEFFEGRVMAAADGQFHFEKDGGFQGKQLKATAYSENQNNTEFSAYVDSALSIKLQNYNLHPRQALPVVPFKDIPFNGIGITQYISCENEETAASYVFDAERMGYKWVRVSIDWLEWSDVRRTGQYSEYKISACQDKAIDLLYQNDVQILYNLVYWDPQIQVFDGYTRFHTDEEVQHYLDYVHFIVEHFKGRIQWYSILNEPNSSDGQSAVQVGDYIALVRQVVALIHEIDPDAKIVIGETTPLNESGAMNYIRTIFKTDIAAMVDGIAWHDGSGNSIEYQQDFYLNYPRLVKEIVSTAQAKGFTGQFFSMDLQWRTVKTPNPVSPGWVFNNLTVGKYYVRGIVVHRAKNLLATVGFQDYETIPDAVRAISSLTNLLAGAQPIDVPVKFGRFAEELRTAAFKLPDGSKLVAIWRDTPARDDDFGLPNTITLSGAKAATLTGIDPLYAFQQELVFSQKNDEIVIENFFIQQYPTFIRFNAP
jgi:hypothetical protein